MNPVTFGRRFWGSLWGHSCPLSQRELLSPEKILQPSITGSEITITWKKQKKGIPYGILCDDYIPLSWASSRAFLWTLVHVTLKFWDLILSIQIASSSSMSGSFALRPPPPNLFFLVGWLSNSPFCFLHSLTLFSYICCVQSMDSHNPRIVQAASCMHVGSS